MIKVSNLFQKLGRFAASYKLSMLALGLTITIIFGLGMVDLKLEVSYKPKNICFIAPYYNNKKILKKYIKKFILTYSKIIFKENW